MRGGAGQGREVADAKLSAVVTATLETLPAGRTQWRSRGMAQAAGLAPSAVQRLVSMQRRLAGPACD